MAVIPPPMIKCRASPIHGSNPTKHTLQKNELKNYECIQQALLLSLLNTKFGFSVEIPSKLSTVTLNMPKLTELNFGEDSINIKKFSEKQYLSYYINDINKGVKLNTATRSYEKRKHVFINSLLIDYAKMIGFTFETKNSRKCKSNSVYEKITTVYYNNELLLTQDDIIRKGRSINNYLFFLVNSSTKVVIDKNNTVLYQYLFSKSSNFMCIKLL
ncbi:TATA-binding protein-associated phosphoprotein [Entamoeba marina]